MCPQRTRLRRSSTGTGIAPRPRTSSATASSEPPCGICRADIRRSTPPGCGGAARRPHRRLAAPTHRYHRRRGHPRRSRRPRRQSDDRHPAAADPRPRPTRLPRRTTHLAAVARPRPPRRNPGPPPSAPHPALTCAIVTASPGPAAPCPTPRTANPARHPGQQPVRTPIEDQQPPRRSTLPTTRGNGSDLIGPGSRTSMTMPGAPCSPSSWSARTSAPRGPLRYGLATTTHG